MRLEFVKSFISVVDHQSFSKAAKSLFISQPTVSTHIRQLEEELGDQLLVRSTKAVLPSEEGRIFYPFAVQLLETEDCARKCLEEEQTGITARAEPGRKRIANGG